MGVERTDLFSVVDLIVWNNICQHQVWTTTLTIFDDAFGKAFPNCSADLGDFLNSKALNAWVLSSEGERERGHIDAHTLRFPLINESHMDASDYRGPKGLSANLEMKRWSSKRGWRTSIHRTKLFIISMSLHGANGPRGSHRAKRDAYNKSSRSVYSNKIIIFKKLRTNGGNFTSHFHFWVL